MLHFTPKSPVYMRLSHIPGFHKFVKIDRIVIFYLEQPAMWIQIRSEGRFVMAGLIRK